MNSKCVLLLCGVFVTAAVAEGNEGSSLSGEVAAVRHNFQKPQLKTGFGSVDFPITCQDNLAQIYFNQGMVMLYHRDESEAERSFRNAADIEPDCVMAYWGLAMANRLTPKTALAHIRKAQELSERHEVSTIEGRLIHRFESDWLRHRGNTGSRNMQQAFAIKRKQIGDPEVEALLLLRMLEPVDGEISKINMPLAERLLRTVLAQRPDHPVQLEWLARMRPDNPEQLLSTANSACDLMPLAPRAWRAAAAVAARAGQYETAVHKFETALQLEHQRMQTDRLLPEQVPGHADTLAGLMRNLTRLGRVRDALAVGRDLIATPCLSADSRDGRTQAICLSAQRSVLDLFARYELWDQAIEMSQSPLWNAFCPELEADKQSVLGSAYYFTGDDERGREQLRKLKSLWLQNLVKNQMTRQNTITTDTESAVMAARRSPAIVRQRLMSRLDEADPALRHVQSAINQLSLNEALANEDWSRLREMVKRQPQIPTGQLARLHLALGNVEQAKTLAFGVPADSTHRVFHLANQVSAVQATGDESTARSQLNKLKLASASADTDLPVIRRLNAMRIRDAARESGATPFCYSRWQPPEAPDLTLPNRQGELISLQNYAGQPVLVVFFLGAGCPHCIEQLQSLAPVHAEFVRAGIQVIAVSTDTMAGVQELYDVADEDGEGEKVLPFVIVSDPQLDRFRAYRAYDEFDDSALHGVFLLDGQRQVLWQNTGKQPYMQIDFLLDEAKRLLSVSTKNPDRAPAAVNAAGADVQVN